VIDHVSEGFMSWMFKGLVFLLPFLFTAYVSTSVHTFYFVILNLSKHHVVLWIVNDTFLGCCWETDNVVQLTVQGYLFLI